MEFLGAQEADVLDSRLEPLDRAIKAFALLVIGVSCVLAFWQLDLIGLTWDEYGDYAIASEFLRKLNFLSNHKDPSQGRLAHLVVTAFFFLFGKSYLVFKLPFVVIGLATGFGLWRILRRQVSANVALLFTALYYCCPFMLAAARTAATAGDILVLTFALAFISTLHAWVNSPRFWPYGALCAAVCGAATGAKWTSGLLLVAALTYQLGISYRSHKTLLRGQLWTEVLAFIAIAAAVAIAASPTFLNGLPFLLEGVKDSHDYDDIHMVYFGEVQLRPPWYYIPALFVSKFPPPLAIVFVLALAQALVFRVRLGSWGVLRAGCLLSLLPIIPLAAKAFQNAHYYIGALPAVFILSALLFDRWVRQAPRFWRFGLLLTAVAVVLYQLLLSLWLAPDFLQAGRQFGPFFQGQFSGPAVNHCQGLPLALVEINRLTSNGGPQTVYQLDDCSGLMEHAIDEGPVQTLVRVLEYPKHRPKKPHYLVVSSIYLYDSRSEHEYWANIERKRRATEGCAIAASHSDFEIFICDTRS